VRQPYRYFNLNIHQLGVSIGLVSISAFFIGLIVAYGLRIEEQRAWRRFAPPTLLWFSTAMLATSSWIFEAARYALRRGRVATYRGRVAGALAFSMMFLATQAASVAQLLAQGIGATSNPHGSAFYLFMSLHAAHLAAGMGWLWILYQRSSRLFEGTENDLRKHRRVSGAAALYWHFMGLLWLVLFFFLLYWTRES
jgi:cytochrome c oxidase subunit 3